MLLPVAWASPRFLPFSMDEFIHYQALACREFPLSRLQDDAFGGSCSRLELRPPGFETFLPLRSYDYIGAAPALAFYPLWLLVGQPVAARLMGALYLLLALALAARLARAKLVSVVLASALLPVYGLMFVSDIGPVGILVCCFLGALLALRAALRGTRPQRPAAWGAVAGLLLAVGLSVKLVFAWYLPAVAAFALLTCAVTPRPERKVVVAAVAAATVACSLPLGMLLLAEDRSGQRFLELAASQRMGVSAGSVAAALEDFARYLANASLLSPAGYVELSASPLDVLPGLLLCALPVAGVLSRRQRSLETLGWVAAFGLTLSCAALFRDAPSPHHFVMTCACLVLAAALGLEALAARSRRGLLIVIGICAVCWWSFGARLASADRDPEMSAGKDRLLAFVRDSKLEDQVVQLHVSWGSYYIASLFGSRRHVVLHAPDALTDARRLERARGIADSLDRGLIVISSARHSQGTPELRSALGPPVATWTFDDWLAIQYLR